VSRNRRIELVTLSLVVAILAGTAAAVGVFFRGDGSVETVVSPRGERYEMIVSGVYRYNAQRVVAEGIGWDIFTLFAAVPALLLCLIWLARGRIRARLFAVGVLAYLFYQYLMYSVTWAFGPLAIFTGVTALRRRPIGYLLSSVMVIKGAAMAAAICAMLVAAGIVEGTLELVPFLIFVAAAAVAVWLAFRIYRSVHA